MPNGEGVPPVFPALAGSAIANGPREGHLDIIINGKEGTAMQAFGKQLDAAQIAAVTHYERHSWGNKTDDITQPRDVIAFMEGQQ
jgi:cytochrome c oxidase subunit 2